MTEPLWVVRRDGSAHEVLTTDGTWGRMVDAAWFESQDDALDATLPAGTTGSVVQAHPDTDPGA